MAGDEKMKSVVEAVKHPFDHPLYFHVLFENIARLSEEERGDPLIQLLCDENIETCHNFDISHLQESWSWRNVSQARQLAQLLTDSHGFLIKSQLHKALLLLEENLFSLGPLRHHDDRRLSRLLLLLRQLYESCELQAVLKRIGAPHGHLVAERLIRETLFLPENTPVTDCHARQAVLSALFTYLRQNVGSCFATAPALLIEREQPLQFFSDMAQLLGSGRIVRVIEGEEYAVPLSPSTGVADLYRPFFLWNLGKNPYAALSHSPGLLAALEASGVVDAKEEPRKKRKKCRELLHTAHLAEDPFVILTPHSVIHRVLAAFFAVSESEIEEYQARPKGRLFGQLIISEPKALTGKSQACYRYLKAFDLARSAFKAVTENALLKAWEFTLASLSETKANFVRWNLYSSLGLHPEEPHGIGKQLYEVVEKKLQKINEEIEEYAARYEQLYTQAKYIEGRISRASTENELNWLRADYQLRRLELNRVVCERDELYDKGRKLANLHIFLINFYTQKCKEYFQEVYDAEMRDISANPYDDSPAGFRLLYKHGRANTSLWTMINSAEEYVQILTSFFVATENELSHANETKGLQMELTDLVTEAVTHVKRPEFLETSFYRLARAYHEPLVQDPLEHLDKIPRKPWSYVSGGTMSTLVSCYWGRAEKPSEKSRFVESSTELLAFYLDTIREMPLSVQNSFKEDPEKALLAFSPTHAFLCKPGWKKFQRGWDNDLYSYTWIRDYWVFPQQEFTGSILLDSRRIGYFVDKIELIIPEGYRPIYRNALSSLTLSMRPKQLRENILTTLSYEQWMRGGRRLEILSEEIDSLLFSHLPLFPEHELQEKLQTLFAHIEEIDTPLKEKLFTHFDRIAQAIGKYRLLSAQDLRNVAKTLLMLAMGKTRSAFPYHQKISDTMEKLGYAYPAPILFADTNWVKNCFGFVVNPGTEELELWRCDDSGTEGRPISLWKRYLNGTDRQLWGLYTSPDQYRT